MQLPRELTTVTPASKFLAIVLFLTLPFLGFLYGMKYQEMVDFNSQQELALTAKKVKRLLTPTPDPFAGWLTYLNPVNGLSLKYPGIFKLTDKKEIADNNGFDYIPLCNEKNLITCLYLADGTNPDTTDNDFTGASLALGVSDNINFQDCTMFKDNPEMVKNPVPVILKKINGIDFSSIKTGEAGLGHQSTDTFFRTWADNSCIEIKVSVHTDSSSQNVPQGQFGIIKPFTETNRKNLEFIFENILSTLKFSNNQAGINS